MQLAALEFQRHLRSFVALLAFVDASALNTYSSRYLTAVFVACGGVRWCSCLVQVRRIGRRGVSEQQACLLRLTNLHRYYHVSALASCAAVSEKLRPLGPSPHRRTRMNRVLLLRARFTNRIPLLRLCTCWNCRVRRDQLRREHAARTKWDSRCGYL